MWEEANHDLWNVLIHKTIGTARMKLRAAQDNATQSLEPGVEGLRTIEHWYTLVGASGMSDLRSRLMKPDTVLEGDIITAIERNTTVKSLAAKSLTSNVGHKLNRI